MDTTPTRGRSLLRSACSLVVAPRSSCIVNRVLCATILALTLAGSLPAATTGSIIGRVVDRSTGKYLEGAEVSVAGTSLHATTSREGVFTFSSVPAGERQLSVTYPGLEPQELTVQVTADQAALVEVKFGGDVLRLEKFQVSGA